MRVCSILNCNKKAHGKGFCTTHYMRLRRYGDVNKVYKSWEIKGKNIFCSIEKCFNRYHAKKYCRKHYRKFIAYGDPLISKLNLKRYCSMPVCDRKYYAKGFCHIHYQRIKKHGHPNKIRIRQKCSVFGCFDYVHSKGLCKKHYRESSKLMFVLHRINQRCNDDNHQMYRYYGGKGIRNYLTIFDLEYLWNRDHGNNLEKPSIDRIDPNNDYTFSNCQFIEMGENTKRRFELERICA